MEIALEIKFFARSIRWDAVSEDDDEISLISRPVENFVLKTRWKGQGVKANELCDSKRNAPTGFRRLDVHIDLDLLISLMVAMFSLSLSQIRNCFVQLKDSLFRPKASPYECFFRCDVDMICREEIGNDVPKT